MAQGIKHSSPEDRVTIEPVLDRAIDLFAENQRGDLAQRASETRQRLDRMVARVVIVGEYKQGKSSLVNAMLNAPVCRVDDLISTDVPTTIRYGDVASAQLIRQKASGETVREPIEPQRLQKDWPEPGESDSTLVSVEVTLPRPLLGEGLELVDTPGTGGMGSYQASSTLTVIPGADAVLVVSDASQEYTAPELKFLQQAAALAGQTCCVVSKTDLYTQWQAVAEANRRHTTAAGIDAPMLQTSSVMRGHALRTSDPTLDQESGFPELVDYLRHGVIDSKKAALDRSSCQELRVMLEYLAMGLRSELETLQASGPDKILRELEAAQQAAADLNDRSARWQQTLNDGVGELLADIDFDLRDRLRRVAREGELLISECDPGETWDEFGSWLADSVTQAVADNFVWAQQRSDWLATTVARHFGEDGAVAMPDMKVSNMEGVLSPVGPLDVVAAGKQTLANKVLTGMRGSYGGVLMFGLLTGLAGMALINPISMTAGVLMGIYTYRHDSEQQLLRRRQDAKVAVRKLCDEATFQVSTESRTRLREVKRILRDHFENVGDDLKRSLQESIDRARFAADTPAEERPPRIDELQHQLKKTNMLMELVDMATPPPESASGPAVDGPTLYEPRSDGSDAVVAERVAG